MILRVKNYSRISKIIIHYNETIEEDSRNQHFYGSVAVKNVVIFVTKMKLIS